MIASSLVPCPTCNDRREFVRAEPAVPKKEGAEIRVFVCKPCRSEMRYMITRHGITLLSS